MNVLKRVKSRSQLSRYGKSARGQTTEKKQLLYSQQGKLIFLFSKTFILTQRSIPHPMQCVEKAFPLGVNLPRREATQSFPPELWLRSSAATATHPPPPTSISMIKKPTLLTQSLLSYNISQLSKVRQARLHPVAGHTGPEGEQRYSSTLS